MHFALSKEQAVKPKVKVVSLYSLYYSQHYVIMYNAARYWDSDIFQNKRAAFGVYLFYCLVSLHNAFYCMYGNIALGF